MMASGTDGPTLQAASRAWRNFGIRAGFRSRWASRPLGVRVPPPALFTTRRRWPSASASWAPRATSSTPAIATGESIDGLPAAGGFRNRAYRRRLRAGEPGFEPGFSVLETERITVNSLPREGRRSLEPGSAALRPNRAGHSRHGGSRKRSIALPARPGRRWREHPSPEGGHGERGAGARGARTSRDRSVDGRAAGRPGSDGRHLYLIGYYELIGLVPTRG